MRISWVDKNSIGSELGLEIGDEITHFDDFAAIDILDYEYYDSLEAFSLRVKRGSGEFVFDIEKDEDETLGLTFEDTLEVKRCKNNCLFCFIDQLPNDAVLRDTLHVKDDDYRHSFISGTYVTLTNLTKSDIDRIIRLKLSPLYISVHSTNEDVRKKLLGIKNAPPLLPMLKELKKGGIDFHTQIVYCPSFNDDIAQTINSLSTLALSLAIVPVGLTKDSNPILKPVTKADAIRVLDIIHAEQEKLLKSKGTRFVFAADELYLKAERKIPHSSHYEEYTQIENGVGLIAKFIEDFDFAVSEAEQENKSYNIGKLSIATGESAFELISTKAKILTRKFGGKITVYKIENSFFGKSVTVAGLITGIDILNALRGKDLGERLLIPSVMLKEFGDVFLDNMTCTRLSKELQTKIQVVPPDGGGFVNSILKRNNL